MDELGLYVPLNSISVISRQWKDEHEKLCTMRRPLDSRRIPPPAEFEPATSWSEVGSVNSSAMRTLQLRTEPLNMLTFCVFTFH